MTTDEHRQATYAERGACWKALGNLERTGGLARAIRNAQYWESFPHSYSTEQVDAACDLMAAWYVYYRDPVSEDSVQNLVTAQDRVLALVEDRS